MPDVIEVDITDEHEFIVLACDGIWDVMHNQQVVGYCRKRLGEGATPEQVCEEIVDRCLAPGRFLPHHSSFLISSIQMVNSRESGKFDGDCLFGFRKYTTLFKL